MTNSSKNKKPLQAWQFALAALAWLLLWQVVSMLVNEELFLPSPLAVAQALGRLALTLDFWSSIAHSMGRIALGFVLGLVGGCVLAGVSAASRFVKLLLAPLVLLARATPVASFIILALVWMSRNSLSVFIGFLMVMPVIYSATLAGIESAPEQMREMGKVFRLSPWKRFRAVYLPVLKPGFLAAVQLAVGLCWKSGIAAEVIGLPRGSIGEHLYDAKMYLMTADVFAWTVVAIFLSWVFGRVVVFAALRIAQAAERGKSLV